ncbi:MAG TPA: hypothetical protein VIP82_20740 [Microbacterium sp.]|uniref:Gp37-like protein n=1 Tax=Microbacterium sp. TaxID=51671 RepID=UPI002F93CC2A
MREHRIEVELQTAGRSFITKIAPDETTCTLRYNAPSTAYLTVKDSHPAVPELLADGVRAAVWMVTVEDNAPVQTTRLLEGVVGDLSGEGPYGTVTIPVIDDFAWFSQILGWQNPGAAITAQVDEYARYSGPSETRALAAIAANATRLGLPWTIAASAGRGTSGTTELRMHPLADRILPALTADRLQLTIERNASTDLWEVAVRAGTAYTRPLTPQSGVLAGWKWRRARPTMTRAVIGGAGQGEEREFALVINPTRETALQRIIEGFDDSRMAEAGANLVPYGQATLADAAAKAGVEATLRETSWFRFPTAYGIGTKVTIQAGAMTAEDVISEIGITHTADAGFVVVPKVGLAVDDPQVRLTEFVGSLATSVRNLERR